jgi:CRISPR-associated protein Cas2
MDDRRRDRVATALLDFGARIQESVFLATLDGELMTRMTNRLHKLVDEEDTLHIFALCAACEAKIQRFGKAHLPEERDYYIL